MNDFYLNDVVAENPFGHESQAQSRTPGLREHLAAGHSITTFPRRVRVGGADINAAVDRFINNRKG
jgi:hypothetical protein